MTEDRGLLNCVSCCEIVGVEDEKESSSVRLFKWSLALQRSKELDWETCSVQEVLSAQLLALIEDQAAYRFLAYSGDVNDAKTALMVGELLRSLPRICALGLQLVALGLYP